MQRPLEQLGWHKRQFDDYCETYYKGKDPLNSSVRVSFGKENGELASIVNDRTITLEELLDNMCIADDKEVFVVEATLAMYKWDESKAEQRVYYYICETMEAVERLIKSLQNVESGIKVYEGISKKKIAEIREKNKRC